MPASVHEHPEEWLAAALADGLAPDERRALDEHLAGCERCRALQADLAALDETLLRDFPLAVGPDGGFETRLVANFRRSQGRGRLEKLRSLAGWLLRQRGGRFAAVAAALVGLVGLGQFLTGGGTPFPNFVQAGSARRPPSTEKGEDRKSPDSRQGNAMRDFVTDAGDNLAARGGNVHPQSFSGSVPVGDIDVGRDVTAGFAEVQVPIIAPRFDGMVASTRTSGRAAGSDVQDQRYSAIFGLDQPVVTKRYGFTEAADLERKPSGPVAQAQVAQEQAPADRVVIVGSNIPSSEEVGTAPTDTPPATPAPLRTQLRVVASGGTVAEGESVSVPPAQNAPAATPAPPDVRKLIRNARAELEVASFDAAVDAVTAAATRDGGFLDTRNSARGGNGKLQGTLVVKVLPENLDRFLAGLRALGDVRGQTVQTEDVTKDYFDTDARLRNSRRMEERLLKMLDEVKGKMAEVLQVEKELARVRAEIETMQGQLRMYDSLVRYATVTLSVSERDLNQPAAFLLRETTTLSLLAADVEKSAAEVRRIADAAHAQTVRSEVTRDPAGKSRATLRLLIAPEAAGEVMAQVKALGRVENFHVQDERIAQNGASADASAQDPAKVERAPVTLDLTISHDEQISRQVSLTLVAADVEGVFEKARAAAVAAGGEIVESNVTHPSAGHANAVLGVRVPASGSAALLASFQSLGRAGETETRRVGSGPETDAGPVLIRLGVVDAEPAVQQTTVRVLTADVERRAADIKREAAASHAAVEESNFASEGDGRQRAGLRFRLSMSAYPVFVERVRALGAVKDFSVQRSDRPARAADAAEAPVIVDLLLYSEGRIVADESGLGATLRRTFGQGAGALMWSVRMIGVALAFLAPWAVLMGLWIGVVKWRRRAGKGLAQSPQSRKEEE